MSFIQPTKNSKPYWSGTADEFAKMIAKGAMEMAEEERRKEAEARAETEAEARAEYEDDKPINYTEEYYNVCDELIRREAYISTLETRIAVAEEYIQQLSSALRESNDKLSASASEPVTPESAFDDLPKAIQPTPNDTYELGWNDISEENRTRFYKEITYISFKICDSQYDPVLNVYRCVYLSYPYEVHIGEKKPDPEHHSGVFYRDVRLAEEKMGIIREMPPSPPPLQRQNAICN